jgi:hypothetical protein
VCVCASYPDRVSIDPKQLALTSESNPPPTILTARLLLLLKADGGCLWWFVSGRSPKGGGGSAPSSNPHTGGRHRIITPSSTMPPLSKIDPRTPQQNNDQARTRCFRCFLDCWRWWPRTCGGAACCCVLVDQKRHRRPRRRGAERRGDKGSRRRVPHRVQRTTHAGGSSNRPGCLPREAHMPLHYKGLANSCMQLINTGKHQALGIELDFFNPCFASLRSPSSIEHRTRGGRAAAAALGARARSMRCVLCV